MKFGSIFENGKSHVIIKIDEKYACKLSEMEQLINCIPSKDMIDLITCIEKDKKLLLEFQKNLDNVEKIRIQDFNWLASHMAVRGCSKSLSKNWVLTLSLSAYPRDGTVIIMMSRVLTLSAGFLM